MGLYDRIKNGVSSFVRGLSPQPYREAMLMAEQIPSFAVSTRMRLLPYIEGVETQAMREAYRLLEKDPIIKSALEQMILPICSLDLEMKPVSKSAIGKEVAEFCGDMLRGMKDGIGGLVYKILYGGYTQGYSVGEKVHAIKNRGKWKGKVVLDNLKAKSYRDYQLEVDEYLNVTSVIGTRHNTTYSTAKFVIYRHNPIYEYPAGRSELQCIYHMYWLKDTVLKLRGIGAERFSIPLLLAKYPQGATPIKTALQQALAIVKAGGQLVIPKEAEVTAVEMSTRSQSDFEAFLNYLDRQIMTGLTGASLQAMQGAENSQRGSSVVHRSIAELKPRRHADGVLEIIKTQILPEIVEWNYGPDVEVPTPLFRGLDDEDLLQRAQIDQILQQMGFDHSVQGMEAAYNRQQALSDEDKLIPLSVKQSQNYPGNGIEEEGSGLADLNLPLPKPEANKFAEIAGQKGAHDTITADKLLAKAKSEVQRNLGDVTKSALRRFL